MGSVSPGEKLGPITDHFNVWERRQHVSRSFNLISFKDKKMFPLIGIVPVSISFCFFFFFYNLIQGKVQVKRLDNIF